MNDRIDRRPPWIPWAIMSLVLVVVAIVAYNAGTYRDAAVAVEPGTRVYRGHWFGGFWLFFLLFWLLGPLRCWGWGGYGYRPWRYGRYSRAYDDERDDWEAWHRRQHERMDGAKMRDASSPSAGTDRGPIT